VRAKPYYSGAVAFVFVSSITGAVASSYEVDGIGERLDPVPEFPTLLCICRWDRVTERAIRLTDCVPSLLHDMHNRLILAIVQIRLSWFILISAVVDRISPCGPPP
jgi:hypothetical protein